MSHSSKRSRIPKKGSNSNINVARKDTSADDGGRANAEKDSGGTSHLKFGSGPQKWDLNMEFSLDEPAQAAVHFGIFQNGQKPMKAWEAVFHFSMFCAIVMGYNFMDLMVGERKRARLPSERYQRLRNSLPHVKDLFVKLIFNNNPKNGTVIKDKYFFDTLRLVRQSMFDLVEDWLHKRRLGEDGASTLTADTLAQIFEEKWNFISTFSSFRTQFRKYWRNKYENDEMDNLHVANPWRPPKKTKKRKKRGAHGNSSKASGRASDANVNSDGEKSSEISDEEVVAATKRRATTRRKSTTRRDSSGSMKGDATTGSDSNDSWKNDDSDSDSSYIDEDVADGTPKRKGGSGERSVKDHSTSNGKKVVGCTNVANSAGTHGSAAIEKGKQVSSAGTQGSTAFQATVARAKQREAKTKAKILAHSVIADWSNYIPAEKRLKPLSQCLQEANYQLFETDKYPQLVEVLFERLKQDKTGTKGQDWKVDADNLQGYYTLGQSRQGFYSFTESHKTYHQHISAVPTTVIGTGLQGEELKKSDVDKVAEFAEANKISFFRHAPGGQHVGDEFLNHCQEGSELFNEVTGGEVYFDAPACLKALLALKEMSEKEDGRRDEANKRGTLSLGGGFGNQNFDDDLPPWTTGLTASSPEMIGLGPTATEHHETIYKNIGHVAGCAGRFGRKVSGDKIPFYHDGKRQNSFGNKLGYLLGAQDSPFEAWSFGATQLGNMEKSEDAEEEFVPDLEHELLRHQDGPNCPKPGYNGTVVYWVLVVDEHGVVWRLAIIFYSRHQCGKAMEREEYTKPVMERMLEWELEMMGGKKFENLTETDFEDWEKVKRDIGNMGKQTVYRTIPFADPMAYFSLTVWTLNMFQEHYPNMNVFRRVQLLYLALRLNSALTFHKVVSRWWPGGESELALTPEGDVDPKLPNFHTMYDLECKKLGWEGGLNAVFPRFNVSPGPKEEWQGKTVEGGKKAKGFLGELPEDAEVIHKNVQRLISILDMVNNGDQHHEQVISRITDEFNEGGLKCIGPVKALAFYSLAVHTGFLYKEHALQQSLEAMVGEGSAFVQYLKEWFPDHFTEPAKDTAAKATRALKRIAFLLGRPLFVLENLGCKMGRGRYRTVKKSSGEKEYWFLLLPSELENNSNKRKEKEDPKYPKARRVQTILRDHPDCFVEGQMLYRREYKLVANNKKEVRCLCKKLSDGPDQWVVQDMTKCLGYGWEEMV